MLTIRVLKSHWFLLAGDTLVLILVTAYGFASHNTLTTAGTRMLTTFFPLLLGWLLISPHLGVFDTARARDPRQLWRPFWAMILAAPFAAFVRSAWLGTAVLPLFVVILGGVSALALLAWRALYWLLVSRWGAADG